MLGGRAAPASNPALCWIALHYSSSSPVWCSEHKRAPARWDFLGSRQIPSLCWCRVAKPSGSKALAPAAPRPEDAAWDAATPGRAGCSEPPSAMGRGTLASGTLARTPDAGALWCFFLPVEASPQPRSADAGCPCLSSLPTAEGKD